MSEVDWKEAPEWAKVVGTAGIEKLLVWSDHKKYSYVNGDCDGRSFNIGATCAWRTDEITIIESRPELQWSGEGLPPVGVVCETSIDMRMLGAETASTDVEIIPEGSHVFVGGHACLGEGFASVAVVRYEDYRGDGYITTCMPSMLRPIRTAGQVAEDDRLAAIEEMKRVWMEDGFKGGGFAALYDAGYRKP